MVLVMSPKDTEMTQQHYSRWRRLKDVLKTSFFFFFRRRLSSSSSEDVFKTSRSRRMFVLAIRLQKISWRRFQNALIKANIFIFAIRLQVVFKSFQRCLQNVLHKRLQDIFKTIWRRSEDVFKTSSRHLQGVLPRHLQDVFKRPWDVLQKPLQDFLKASPRRLQDIFKTSWKDVFKTFSRRIIRFNCLGQGFA